MHASQRRSILTGLALAVTGSALFSGKAIVVKLAYRYGVDPLTAIALRMAFAAPLFVVAYWWAARGAPPLTRGNERAIASNKRSRVLSSTTARRASI